MIGIIVLVVVIVVAGAGFALSVIAKGKKAVTELHATSKDMIAAGKTPDDVAKLLAEDRKLPPGQSIAIVSDVAGVTPREAIDVLRPYLTEGHQKTYDAMTDERLQTSKDRLLKG